MSGARRSVADKRSVAGVDMDKDLFPERVAYRAGPIITGRFFKFMEGYPREITVKQPILVAVLTAAGVAQVIGLLLASVLRAGAGSSARRKWKDLRKGPEFLVTPLRIRDTDGVLCEMEIHGHLPQSALQAADYIQVTVRPQKDRDLPPRVERIVNLTTGQLLTPRTPTLWSHLGPPLVLQAVLGVLVIAAVAACTIVTAG